MSQKNSVTANAEQQVFVIPESGGYSCFGFENAKTGSEQIAATLKRDDLLPVPEEYGTIAAYKRYRRAVEAWSLSVLSRSTYFQPGTDRSVRKVLEKFRGTNELLRLFYGDPDTGLDWCEENEVVGHIGRSTGPMRVPLLVEAGESGGSAILSSKVLRIIRVSDGKEHYRHPKYQLPVVSTAPCNEAEHPTYTWAGFRDGILVARFTSDYEAAEWAAFLTGRIPCKFEAIQKQIRFAA